MCWSRVFNDRSETDTQLAARGEEYLMPTTEESRLMWGGALTKSLFLISLEKGVTKFLQASRNGNICLEI